MSETDDIDITKELAIEMANGLRDIIQLAEDNAQTKDDVIELLRHLEVGYRNQYKRVRGF